MPLKPQTRPACLALLATVVLGLVCTGCRTGHAGSNGLTVGTVQREIRKGMSGGEVAAALGSPNIVTTDENSREVWIYDRMATDRVESSASGGVWLLFLGGGASSVGGGASSSSSSSSQRTLTVIIKFDEKKRVRDFAYHASRF